MTSRKLFLFVALFAFLSIGLFAFPGHAAAATCTWNGTTGNWSDSTKWSCAAVPGAADTAVINGGTVTLTGAVTVDGLTLNGGTLTGGFDIDVTGTLTWSGGTMSGTGNTILDTTGTLDASGTGTLYLDTRTFENDGTVNFNKTGGYLYLTNNATFNNMLNANFNVLSASTYIIYGNTGVFNNQSGATFTKSSSGETSITNLTSFNNAGTLTLSGANILHIDPTGTSTDTGPFTISNASATLDFAGGIHNLNTGANITGSGSVDFSSGTVSINSTYNLSGGTSVTGGTVSFPSGATLTSLGGSLTISGGSIDISSGENPSITSLTQSGGTLTGSDTLTINTSLTWTGGTESGTGITNLAASGTMATSGSSSLTLDTRTFNNAGTVNWNSTGYLYMVTNATFNNQSGANFNVQNAGTYVIYGSTSTFNNQSGATFTKSSSGETSITNLTSFNNAGTLALTGANILHLDPTGSSTDTGPFTISNASATLDFAGGIHNLNTGANITGSGSVDFSSGTVYINSTYNLSGGTSVTGGTVSFSSSATLTSLGGSLTISGGSIDISSGENPSITSLAQSGGTLTGSDTLTINTSLTWTGGTESGTGITNLAASGTMATSGSSSLTLDTRTFNNAGTVNWNSTGYLYMVTNATFNNQSSANYNVQNAGTYVIYGSTGVFNNQSGATFTKSSSGDTGIYYLTSFNNAGTLALTGAGVFHLSPSGTSTDTGPFTISNANATLDFASGIHNLNTGANITGSGSVDFSSGTVYINSTYNLSGGTSVTGGTVSFPSGATLTSLGGSLTISGGSIDISSGENLSITSLTQSGGTLTGSDAITVTTTLNWSGGTMSGYGVTNLTASGTMATSGSSSITLDTRTFNNAGTVNWNSTGYLYMITNATFNNKSGANFNVQSAGTYVIYGSTGVFNNQSGATLTKSSSGDTGIYYLTSFNNAGTLALTGAGVFHLSPSGTSTDTGPFHIDAGATLDFGGGTTNINTGANFSGSGIVSFSGGTEYIHSTYNLSGGTTASGGTVSFASDATLTSLGSVLTISGGSLDLSSGENPSVPTLNESNGTLTGGDTITVTTSLNWGGGTMSGTGATNLAATGTMVTSATGYDTLTQRTFNNAGTINWTSTGYLSLNSNATFNNLSGATFTFNVPGSVSYIVYGYAGTFVNAGTLNLPASGYLVANQFTQTSSGVINMAISGTLAGTNFCQMTGTTSTLGGQLNVTLNIYSPVFGDHFDVFLYTNHTGAFSQVSLPPLNAGLAWEPIYQTDRLRLNIMRAIYIPVIIKQ